MNEIEKGILEYLESKKGDIAWKFVLGEKVYSAEMLIEEFKKDKKLREFIIKQVSKFAFEQLTKGVK
ncbi:MAG: hypothetical protein QXP52_00185 [Candidatus Aenigmatarchaeota archaeon]